MSIRPLLLACAVLLSAEAAFPHGAGPRAVIVDTDMALDDIRALALLIADGSYDLIACVSSDGACSPDLGAAGLRRILARLGRGDVPVGAGRVVGGDDPAWRPLSESLVLAGPSSAPSLADGFEPAGTLLRRVLSDDISVVYLCLGPLSNLADLLAADPTAAWRLEAVHYLGAAPDDPNPGWNTQRDLAAARRIFAAGLPLRCLQPRDDQLLRYDPAMSADVCALAGPAPELLCAIHADPRVRTLIDDGHFRCWDESLVLDLLRPGLFTTRSAADGEPAICGDLGLARRCYLDLLAGATVLSPGSRQPVVMSRYPAGVGDLQPDVAAIAGETLQRHGRVEWESVLLTNELHGHLGLYSILGAKMGIRALELLGAGLDEVDVLSRAGAEAPLSCLTDGLQVATGATLGRGSIAVDPEAHRPGARFAYDGSALELTLKPEVLARVRRDILACLADHGALTPAYWQAIRALGLRYWLEMDRTQIFDEAWGPR